MTRVLEGRNRASAEEMTSFVDKYEQLENEVLREKMSYMERCRRIRTQQKDLLDDAKSQGWEKKSVKDAVKYRDLGRKQKALLDDQEDDRKKDLVDLLTAFGDFADMPLAQAAINADDSRTSAVVNAVKGSLTPSEQDDWDRAAPAGSA